MQAQNNWKRNKSSCNKQISENSQQTKKLKSRTSRTFMGKKFQKENSVNEKDSNTDSI